MKTNQEHYIRIINRILNNELGKSKITGIQAKKLSTEQLNTLRKYKDYYEDLPSIKGGKIKVSSVLNVLVNIRELGVFLQKPYEKATKEDIINYFKQQGKIQSLRTINRAKINIRQFYKWVYGIKHSDKHSFPDVVDDDRLAPANLSKTEYVRDLKVLSKDDVLKMIDNAFNSRDKALIMTLFEGGFRAREISSAKIKSLVFDEQGCKLYTEVSKTDRREVRLIDAEPYLRKWVNEHPDKNNEDAPLFCSIKTGVNYKGEMYIGIGEMLRRVSKRAGINKRVFPHLFRHSAITKDSNDGFPINLNALRHGITLNTLQGVYLHETIKDANDYYVGLKGELTDEQKVQRDDERKKTQPKICPRCKLKNEASVLYCSRCGLPMSDKAVLQLEQEKKASENRLDKIEALLIAMADKGGRGKKALALAKELEKARA